MDWRATSAHGTETRANTSKRWVTHRGHAAVDSSDVGPGPHARVASVAELQEAPEPGRIARFSTGTDAMPRETRPGRLVTLDGSHGEGGGQILRTALTLSMLTGTPFRMVKIRANRENPGLRPQHLKAVQAAATLASAEVSGDSVGARDLTFRPAEYTPRDLAVNIGTAGATALVLQTLHLPIALRAESAVRVTLTGGTFNTKAPSYPFLETTWRAHMIALGAPIALSMPLAGFYPRGGGHLEAWIEPANLLPLALAARGPLTRIRGVAGVSGLNPSIAERMRDRALARLTNDGIADASSISIDLAEWSGTSPGAAIALIAEYEDAPVPVTFVGLGERGKPAETVADDAVDELLAHDTTLDGAIDPHSADQLLIPLALTPARGEYTVSDVTEHLRTNARTIQSFLPDRSITIEEPHADRPGRVIIV